MAYQIGKHNSTSIIDMSDNTGGMNVADPPYRVANNQCVEANNFDIDFVGNQFRTRPALSKALVSLNYPIQHSWYDIINHSLYLFAGYSNQQKHMYRYNVQTKSIQEVGLTTGTSDTPSCVYFNKNIYIASGGVLQVVLLSAPSWLSSKRLSLLNLDGSYSNGGNTTLKSPNVELLETKDGRLIATSKDDDTMYFSAVNDCLSANTLGLIDDADDASHSKYIQGVGKNDNSAIVAIFVVLNDIIVFKRSGNCYTVSGVAPDWYVTKIASLSDVISAKSIVPYNGGLLYYSTSGMKVLTTKASYGNYNIQETIHQINPVLSQKYTTPWVSFAPNTHKIFISSDSKSGMYIQSTQTGGVTHWDFPSNTYINGSVEIDGTVYVITGTSDNKHGYVYSLSNNSFKDFGTSTIHQKYTSRQLTFYDLLTSHIQNIRVKSLGNQDGQIDMYVQTGDRIYNQKPPILVTKWKYKATNPVNHVRTQVRDESLQYILETDSPICLEHFSESVIQNANGGAQSGGQWSALARTVARE